MEIFIDRIDQPVTFGIDLYSFDVKPNQPFHGFKKVPRDPRFHIVHFQHSTVGVRYGYYFEADKLEYLQFEYDRTQELYKPRSLETEEARRDGYNKFQQLHPLMVPYPSVDEGDSWFEITKFVKMLDVKYIAGCSGHFVYMDSAVTTEEEKGILRKALAKGRHTGGTGLGGPVPQEELSLNYSAIVFKSKDAIRPEHKMQDFLDKSYYLNEVILPRHHHSSIYSLFGELQWAFLNALMFGNYASSLQWHNIVELLAFSSRIKTVLLAELDALLAAQLASLPSFYVDTLLNEDVWVRVLHDSHHSTELPNTGNAIRKLWPHLGEVDSEPDALLSSFDRPYAFQHDGDDDSGDENGPVVAERVIYR
ncbi:LADA_0H09032g1_1 [Lachancea dasiensis]|uniref:LADA_0H09032g1_1 n=1 Tax=Lachancea dasiensis TaxID=1072105 RepID=A0A1G4K2M4_9SACH|nr:LADA_0H09032g1_1 [Lachancea dasiensis]